MKDQTSTGYDGGGESPEPTTFELRLYSAWPATSGITCHLIRNRLPVGMLRLENEEEFVFLKARIDGIFDPEIESGRDPERSDQGNR